MATPTAAPYPRTKAETPAPSSVPLGGDLRSAVTGAAVGGGANVGAVCAVDLEGHARVTSTPTANADRDTPMLIVHLVRPSASNSHTSPLRPEGSWGKPVAREPHMRARSERNF